jgi:hypothetical protein
MGQGVGLADVLLAVALHTVTRPGIAAGFHRLITQLYCELFPELRKMIMEPGIAPIENELCHPSCRRPERRTPQGASSAAAFCRILSGSRQSS